MQENSRMNFAKVLISTLIFAGSVHAQQDTHPVIPVEPVIARTLTSEEVKERRALMDTPSISQTYNTQFSGSMPIGSAPVALMPGEFLNKVAQTWEPTQSFSVKPKDSIMIPVGQGLMNTLSTNLIRVTAKSNDDTSAFEIDEGYLYVPVNTLNPISIILYEEGALDSQISVTLVPIPAPPTLVEIEFDLSDAIIAKAKLYREEEAFSSILDEVKGWLSGAPGKIVAVLAFGSAMFNVVKQNFIAAVGAFLGAMLMAYAGPVIDTIFAAGI
jgi:hypothetical protein